MLVVVCVLVMMVSGIHGLLMAEIEDVPQNSTDFENIKGLVSALGADINADLIDAGVRFNYGCWDHQRLKQAKKQLVNGQNYWAKLQLLCDPKGNFGHVYFYGMSFVYLTCCLQNGPTAPSSYTVPINIDAEGHVEHPQPKLMAIQYPRSAEDALEAFRDDDIAV